MKDKRNTTVHIMFRVISSISIVSYESLIGGHKNFVAPDYQLASQSVEIIVKGRVLSPPKTTYPSFTKVVVSLLPKRI